MSNIPIVAADEEAAPSPALRTESVAKPWRIDHRATAALVALITLAGLYLRMQDLAVKNFWRDEGMGLAIVRLPWGDFSRIIWQREANMVLYYLLLRGWLWLGSTPGFIRGLSVLFSVATIPLVYVLGRRLFGPATGVLAAWLLAINAYHIRYAQEARGYALMVFLCAAAAWLLTRNLQQPSSARWGLYGALCALAVYAHFYAALFVLAQYVSLFFLPRSEVPWRHVARSLVWFVCLTIPIGLFIARAGTGPLHWIPPSSGSVILAFLIQIAGNYGIRLLILCAGAAAVAGFAAWSSWRGDGKAQRAWGYALVFSWMFVPLLLILAISVVRPYFFGRFLNPAVPALSLLVATGIARLRPPALGWVLCFAISVGSILGAVSYYRRDFDLHPWERRDWRAAASFILDHAQPGDSVFFYGDWGHMLFEVYRHERHPIPRWPDALESDNGLDVSYGEFFNRDLGEVLRDSRPAGNRVWLGLVYDTGADGSPNRPGAAIREKYGKDRQLVEQRRFTDITVLLYARDPGKKSLSP